LGQTVSTTHVAATVSSVTKHPKESDDVATNVKPAGAAISLGNSKQRQPIPRVDRIVEERALKTTVSLSATSNEKQIRVSRTVLLQPEEQVTTHALSHQWCLLSRCRAYTHQPHDVVAPLVAELHAKRQLANQSLSKIQEWQESSRIAQQCQPDAERTRLALEALCSQDDTEWWSRRYSTTPEELENAMSEDDDSDHDISAHMVDVPRSLQTRGGQRRKKLSTLPEQASSSGSDSNSAHSVSSSGSDTDESGET
jgi:hypothetical protein